LIKALEPGDGVVALVAAYVHDHLPPGTIEIPRKKGSFLRWFARFNVVNTLLGYFPNITIHASSFLWVV
jgi:uncharacterized membrane protein YqaE (UPF0057 family)